jgi:hypothetical protein
MENKILFLFEPDSGTDNDSFPESSCLKSVEFIRVEAKNSLDKLVKYFLKAEATPVCSWWTALNVLNQGETAFVVIDQKLDSEFFTFLKNLYLNKKEFCIYDSKASQTIPIKINNDKGKLFLVGKKQQIDPYFPFVDYELLKNKVENALFESE